MPTRRATLRSLAKINLDLRVLNKRADGYHELRSVFQTISLADTIEVEYQPSPHTEISLEDPLASPDTLVLRAARAVLDESRRTARVRFRLSKRIPMGGGLGGGSSNAAAVLLALPPLAGFAIPFDRLRAIATMLGSDVPFFLTGGTAVGLGRGEELYPLADLKPEPLLIVSTGLHVSTAEAYRGLARGLTFPALSRSINGFQAFVGTLGDGGSARRASALSANDFELVVFRQYPQIKTVRDKLSKLGPSGVSVRMTGSGSALFAVFASVEERRRALAILERDRVFRDCQAVPASLVSRVAYRRLWRKQLREHIDPDIEPGSHLWPPPSRYAR
jgi:4-diphosphocytidyl-2-C-methyl-D-erythritol kinase